MKKLLIAFTVSLLFSTYCIAQKISSISGKIIYDNGFAATSASVALFTLKDSTLTKVVITANNGEFEMPNIKPGKYFINVTSIGYKKSNSPSFELKDAQSFFLAPITLLADHTKLTNVNLQSKRPMIEVTADKTIFNIEGSINATGSDAFELLQN